MKLVQANDGFLNLNELIFARSQITASLALQVVRRVCIFIPQCLGSSLALSDSLLRFSNWFSVIEYFKTQHRDLRMTNDHLHEYTMADLATHVNPHPCTRNRNMYILYLHNSTTILTQYNTMLLLFLHCTPNKR